MGLFSGSFFGGPGGGLRLDMTVVEQGDVAFEGARERKNRLSVPFRAFDARVVSKFFRRQFETSGTARAGTEAWEPLAPSTKERRVRTGGNRGGINRPLWDEGGLKQSLQNVGPESIRVITNSLYVRGTRLARGAFHQEGAGNVPAREIVPDPWPPTLVDQWDRTLRAWIESGEAGLAGLSF